MTFRGRDRAADDGKLGDPWRRDIGRLRIASPRDGHGVFAGTHQNGSLFRHSMSRNRARLAARLLAAAQIGYSYPKEKVPIRSEMSTEIRTMTLGTELALPPGFRLVMLRELGDAFA